MAIGMNHIQRRGVASVAAVAIMLLVAMCMQWSFGPAYLLRLSHVRHEMKARILGGLSEDRITSLHFPASAVERIEWMDGGREVRAHGHLFDIVAVKVFSDGSIVIKAVRDDQEGQVLAELDRDVWLRLGQDAKGKERGSRIISSWAAYCHLFAQLRVPVPPAGDMSYGEPGHTWPGALADVDPDPPRMS